MVSERTPNAMSTMHVSSVRHFCASRGEIWIALVAHDADATLGRRTLLVYLPWSPGPTRRRCTVCRKGQAWCAMS